MKWPRLRGDLFAELSKPRTRAKKATAFHPLDLARILAAVDLPRQNDTLVDEGFACLVHVLTHTGVRIGEGLAIQWKDVDFDAARLYVRASIAEVKGGVIERKETKSGDERRIPLGPGTVRRLRRLRGQAGAIRLGNQFVFATEKGRPLRKSNILRRRWHKLLAELEIDRCGFHKLRHTFASLSLQAGLDIGTVSKLLGHAERTFARSGKSA